MSQVPSGGESGREMGSSSPRNFLSHFVTRSPKTFGRKLSAPAKTQGGGGEKSRENSLKSRFQRSHGSEKGRCSSESGPFQDHSTLPPVPTHTEIGESGVVFSVDEGGEEVGSEDPSSVAERLLTASLGGGPPPPPSSLRVDHKNLQKSSSFSGARPPPPPPIHREESASSAMDAEPSSSKEGMPKKKRSFAPKISFLNKKKGGNGAEGGAGGGRLTREELASWTTSFDKLLHHKQGVSLFRAFLEREFSDENMDFWIACEEYKSLGDKERSALAKEIYHQFVAVQSPKEVNLDSKTRDATRLAAEEDELPGRDIFDDAQHRIQNLMAKDSYPRFLKSDLYLTLIPKK